MRPDQTAITIAVAKRRRLIGRLNATSSALQQYCAPHRGAMGLVSDEAKATDEYARLSLDYEVAKYTLEVFMKAHKDKAFKLAFADETLRHYGRK